MIEVLDLCKTFHDRKKGDIPAVKGITFQCSPGRVFGLLGRNGAGKTTTLRMLATILTPTSGTARVAGHDVNEKPGEVRKRIGYLSGDTKLYDRLTGRELLTYFGELAGMSRASIAERICDEIAIIERGAILAQGTVASLRSGHGGGTLEDVFVETVEAVTSDL